MVTMKWVRAQLKWMSVYYGGWGDISAPDDRFILYDDLDRAGYYWSSKVQEWKRRRTPRRPIPNTSLSRFKGVVVMQAAINNSFSVDPDSNSISHDWRIGGEEDEV